MAGHSKWAQIKRQKAVSDAAKSRVFARYARLITVEAKKSGPGVVSPALQTAINRAKAENMPKDNIERAIARATQKDAAALETVICEAYGPGSVAIIVDALTDSKNRTIQEIKLILTKQGIELSSPGSAAWAFTKASDGTFTPNEPLIDVSGETEEKLVTLLEKLEEQSDVQAVYTNARGYESTGD
jgi:YebC/PmpR family DNA-binding regulatory protein